MQGSRISAVSATCAAAVTAAWSRGNELVVVINRKRRDASCSCHIGGAILVSMTEGDAHNFGEGMGKKKCNKV